MSPEAEPQSTPQIWIQGAREHNLKNLSVGIPHNGLVVITGVSGSGKSTLAFDLLFSEGQRRFLDSMNAYARQFVEALPRPDVDLISGLPPTVSIEQRTSRGGGKSTVATVTEIYHFIRLLFARLGTQFCPQCDEPVEAQSRDELANRLRAELRRRGDLLLLAPVVKNRKGFHSDVAEWAARHGHSEIRADGKIYSTAEPMRLDRFREHDVEIVTGVMEGRKPRQAGASAQQLIDVTLDLGKGTLLALDNHGRTTVHSTERVCRQCGLSFQALDPKIFSYNSAQGWCPRCRGFGELFYLPEVDRGARADAIEESWYQWQEGNREQCPECNGTRLNAVARAVRLRLPGVASSGREGVRIEWLANQAVEQAAKVFGRVVFTGREALIARDILPEILERLRFLEKVGLGYLQLGRGVPTLSGGESQRIRLAAQLGSNLSGVLYVLDEPTIGLHARDNDRLLEALALLRSRGNSLVVVEHDESTMRKADHIIDLGPGAGVQGGTVVATGSLQELMANQQSVTGHCLRAHKTYPARGTRRPVKLPALRRPDQGKRSHAEMPLSSGVLELNGARVNNLKNLRAEFPLGRLVLVTGVSGSGKSSLIRECLLPALQAKLAGEPSECGLRGFEGIASVFEVDQTPIGRTPRSVPATYVGFFDQIRGVYAQTSEARLRGYSPSRFSFNSAQGRCPECEGAGTVKMEMNFLPPAFVRCEVCEGCRFNRETLDIEFHGKNIAQVLEMSVNEALGFFGAFPRIRRPLEALAETGLGYLQLGQTSPALSGGEAQRVKLVTHLLSGLKEPTLFQVEKRNLFILEEPTIGLHMADIKLLVAMLQRLVDVGHSVIVIEHNLELIAEADWVIDLGPEAGNAGGQIVGVGTPEVIAETARSHTGHYLQEVLASGG